MGKRSVKDKSLEEASCLMYTRVFPLRRIRGNSR